MCEQRERVAASEQQAVLRSNQAKEEQRLKLEMQGLNTQLAHMHSDLKKLVLMIYKVRQGIQRTGT